MLYDAIFFLKNLFILFQNNMPWSTLLRKRLQSSIHWQKNWTSRLKHYAKKYILTEREVYHLTYSFPVTLIFRLILWMTTVITGPRIRMTNDMEWRLKNSIVRTEIFGEACETLGTGEEGELDIKEISVLIERVEMNIQGKLMLSTPHQDLRPRFMTVVRLTWKLMWSTNRTGTEMI